MVVTSFVHLQKINNFPKFGRCGSKIGHATPIWNSKLNWVWQAQFLSHIHEFLQNYLFFKDLQMILVSFFEIFDGFWSTKKLLSLLLHVNQDLLNLKNWKGTFIRFLYKFVIFEKFRDTFPYLEDVTLQVCMKKPIMYFYSSRDCKLICRS